MKNKYLLFKSFCSDFDGIASCLIHFLLTLMGFLNSFMILIGEDRILISNIRRKSCYLHLERMTVRTCVLVHSKLSVWSPCSSGYANDAGDEGTPCMHIHAQAHWWRARAEVI